MATDDDGFGEYRRHILAELKRLSNSLDKLEGVVSTIAVEIGQLKAIDRIRAGFWGSIGGVVTAIIVTILIGRLAGQ